MENTPTPNVYSGFRTPQCNAHSSIPRGPLQVARPQGCPLATSPGSVPDLRFAVSLGGALPSPTATSPSLDTSNPLLIQSLS